MITKRDFILPDGWIFEEYILTADIYNKISGMDWRVNLIFPAYGTLWEEGGKPFSEFLDAWGLFRPILLHQYFYSSIVLRKQDISSIIPDFLGRNSLITDISLT